MMAEDEELGRRCAAQSVRGTTCGTTTGRTQRPAAVTIFESFAPGKRRNIVTVVFGRRWGDPVSALPSLLTWSGAAGLTA